jgi:probable HAF family extracellular repeat protein
MKALKTPSIPASGRVINAGGEVAGRYSAANGYTRSFLATACDCPRDLGTLGGNQSFVFGINDAGQLAGSSEDAAGHRRAFLYENGAMKDLGTFGGKISEAAAINPTGQIAGYAQTKTGDAHAFVYDGKLLKDLGTLGGSLSQANSINAAGQVTGFAYTAKGEQHAMTWTQAGGMVDLNKVLRHAPPGLVLSNGLAISDDGSIVAQANPGLVLLKPHYVPK